VQVLERFRDGVADGAGALRIRLVVWGAFASACLALSAGSSPALVTAAVGAVIALALVRDTVPGRVAAAIGIAVAGVADGLAPEAVLLIGAVLVALAPVPSDASGVAGGEALQVDFVQRHLARARRRAERAHVLLMSFASEEGVGSAEVMSFFRLTDSVSLRKRGGTTEVLALLDDHDLDRSALEHRINAHLASEPQLGWASFPDDGYTLADLVQRARERQGTEIIVSAPSQNGHHKSRLAS